MMKKICKYLIAGLVILASLTFSSCGLIMSDMFPGAYSEIEKYYGVEVTGGEFGTSYSCNVISMNYDNYYYVPYYSEEGGSKIEFTSDYYADWVVKDYSGVRKSSYSSRKFTFNGSYYGEGTYILTVNTNGYKTTYNIYVSIDK